MALWCPNEGSEEEEMGMAVKEISWGHVALNQGGLLLSHHCSFMSLTLGFSLPSVEISAFLWTPQWFPIAAIGGTYCLSAVTPLNHQPNILETITFYFRKY